MFPIRNIYCLEMCSFSAGRPGGKRECWGVLAEPGPKVNVSLFNMVNACSSESYLKRHRIQ